MSGWTTITLRGLYGNKYEYSSHDSCSPSSANNDLLVSLSEDSRISDVGYWNGHVYATLSTGRYDFETAEVIISECSNMVYDAVVIGANDTTDTGIARYYPVYDELNGPAGKYTDLYRETQSEDGCTVGAVAASVMTARHGIIAQETLGYRAVQHNGHRKAGPMDSQFDSGTNRLN